MRNARITAGQAYTTRAGISPFIYGMATWGASDSSLFVISSEAFAKNYQPAYFAGREWAQWKGLRLFQTYQQTAGPLTSGCARRSG